MADWSLSKGNALEFLRGLVQNVIVDKLLIFTVAEWKSSRDQIISDVQSYFSSTDLVMIRSSALNEDQPKGSFAGYFHTESGVSVMEKETLVRAIGKVIASYSRGGRLPQAEDQVIVQVQVQELTVSGVVLTRDLKFGSPYYVINYDGDTGRTDTVTGGRIGKALRIVRWYSMASLPDPWSHLVEGVQQIEAIFRQKVLNIEFAYDRSKRIHIFQVRPISYEAGIQEQDDEVRQAIIGLKTDVQRLDRRIGKLAGSSTVLADMADWNPAEMIGSRPNMLDRSLYRFLLTASAWNEARVSMGYTDVAPSELMVVMGDKPYVDTRVSFNSLTPSDISSQLKERLIDYYLDRLSTNPELQDKVEFEIVCSCYDLSYQRKAAGLREKGFGQHEVDFLRQYLLRFTNRLLESSASIIKSDLALVGRLDRYAGVDLESHRDITSLLQSAKDLLIACRTYGTIPFSRLARLAFIGMAIFRSLAEADAISREFLDEFPKSIDTIATQMRRDFISLNHGALDTEVFMNRYGHLRPGTYNILAPRYDHNPDLFSGSKILEQDAFERENLTVDERVSNWIGEALSSHGIECSADAFLGFIRDSIRSRELSKFKFTRSLSDAIELIALAGEQSGISRDDLALVDLRTILEAGQNGRLTAEYFRDLCVAEAIKNRETKKVYSMVALPPVIRNEVDLDVAPYHEAYPNFVTHKRVEGKVCLVDQFRLGRILDIAESIVLMESADPGYDWVFTQLPRGVITKYGGVGSHMAIRCAEFGLPAAIGCGEVIFERLAGAQRVVIDCSSETVFVS